MSSNRFSAAWLERSYTIAITVPLKQQRTRSTVITLNGTNTFMHTLKEQDTRSGDKSRSKVNFTKVIIAKIPFIVGERLQSDWRDKDEECLGLFSDSDHGPRKRGATGFLSK